MQLTSDQEKRLRELMAVFLEENKKLNLSAYRKEEACWIGNVLDSVGGGDVLVTCHGHSSSAVACFGTPASAPLRRATQHDVKKILDLGTGGGFPLLPLAILFPEISFIGLDATKKKAEAVRRIVNKLGLTNVDLLIGRAEELGHDPLCREQYDVVLSRATASLPTLLEFMSPFVKVSGCLLCWKSMHIDEELLASIPARMALSVRLVDRSEYDLPGDWGKRQILVFEKTGKLAGKYPRGVGIPKMKPLT